MMLEEKFLSDLLEDIHHNRLILPTLLEVALKVDKVVDNPDANAGQIASVTCLPPGSTASADYLNIPSRRPNIGGPFLPT